QGSGSSCVAGVPVLRQEELVDEPVRLEQTGAVQLKLVPLQRQEAPLTEAVQLRRAPVPELDAELGAEVARVHAAELELQDQLADHPLFGRRGQRAVDRQLSRLDPGGGRAPGGV